MRRWPGPRAGVEDDALPPLYTCGAYAGVLRAVVVAHKEQARFGLRGELARLMAQAIGAGASRDVPVLAVPVPSRAAVVRSRGHDPLHAITARAVRELSRAGHPVRVANLLRVRGRAADQAGLGVTERFENMQGRMACCSRSMTRARGAGSQAMQIQVVLCDDVVTTGATLREAHRALQAVGLQVAAVATIAATARRENEYAVNPYLPLSWVGGSE